ncbi:LpxL/LpxP family Kdo(2)-lipid IV(A) lauroyl/palmitoleoyl acyltransferase [Vibrio sp. JPW-9-11-11]|uniref:LpxL/LpxP family Kdo(2)-lipid IV(A) lauroyl/palmitoleoyl acyltransferase n=1 Tax=Vibrio sp. JPW-9-11-11 TaxID=1416532 RepID=UPI001593F668|nr:LpxL/LpxP family Kdo(2)-lipid IV(A) lauroyl/palmitoleoyl acyltransferase [Vibrio sp. JPW-9-11-11]NVD05352.1 LpxL/LpxP family Kdo(2)-lipid IV(A) lauroyl/palmitoleoyl acyltransferase [Vibrio sp. JPW-9-11-11]
MSKKSTVEKPKFTLALIHPKYWGVWLGFGLLALIVNLLPYAVLYRIGRGLGKLGMKLGKSRVKVARRNLELAFPEMAPLERDKMVEENFKNTGMALIETGITWFWPTWRFKRRIVAKDIDLLHQYKAQGKGVLLCCVHALNLEITARAFAVLGLGGYGAFRPHNNPAYNLIQYWGRSHNGNVLIDRKDIKQMIRVMRSGERLFYLPDHDYGRNKSVFVPFFAVQDACTTTGTSILAYTSKAAIVMGSGFRNPQGQYEILANKSVEEEYPQKDEKAAAAYMNRHVEEVILRAPEQWMWLHKRYKTMEDESIEKGIRYK